MTRRLLLILSGSLAAAQHAPVGNPSGNPISRPLNEIVTTCRPFTITWQPTTSNTISLVLLLGPSTNVRPISTIITGIANSGSYVWTPSGALEADTTHYGLQLIDDVTGQYQYSTQFGIAKGSNCDSAASPSSANTSPPPSSPSAVTGASPTPAISSSPSAVTTPGASPALTSSSLSTITSSTPSAAATNRLQDTSGRSPNALKPGIAAAIGIGTTAGVAFFAMAVFMAYRLGRRRDTAHQGDDVAADTDTKVEYLKSELHAQSVGELHGQHVMHELHGGSAVILELASPVAELHDGAMGKEEDSGSDAGRRISVREGV